MRRPGQRRYARAVSVALAPERAHIVGLTAMGRVLPEAPGRTAVWLGDAHACSAPSARARVEAVFIQKESSRLYGAAALSRSTAVVPAVVRVVALVLMMCARAHAEREHQGHQDFTMLHHKHHFIEIDIPAGSRSDYTPEAWRFSGAAVQSRSGGVLLGPRASTRALPGQTWVRLPG